MAEDFHKTALAKLKLWQKWHRCWWVMSILFWLGAASFTLIVTAELDRPIVPTGIATWIGIAGALLSSLITVLRPQEKANAYEAASRELECAIDEFESLDQPSNDILFKAIAKGINLLHIFGSS